MSKALQQLADRIRNEVAELERVLQRIEDVWQLALPEPADYYLDSIALNLHGLYNGLERVFELIAAVIDSTKPTGESWHQLLLEQMAELLAFAQFLEQAS